MTATEILKGMAQRYSQLKSYEDRGCVTTRYPDRETPTELTFATFFQRPDKFRFEWTTHHPYEPLRHIKTHRRIWCDGTNTFLFNSRTNSIDKQENLEMAIARATGVSQGAAHTIPALLMPAVGGFVVSQLEHLSLSFDEFENVECYKIEGKHPMDGERQELWIEKNDLLLLKLRYPDSSGVDSFEARKNIQINRVIEDTVFTAE
jgi:outer membrane lipoprotein-sorting protein